MTPGLTRRCFAALVAAFPFLSAFRLWDGPRLLRVLRAPPHWADGEFGPDRVVALHAGGASAAVVHGALLWLWRRSPGAMILVGHGDPMGLRDAGVSPEERRSWPRQIHPYGFDCQIPGQPKKVFFVIPPEAGDLEQRAELVAGWRPGHTTRKFTLEVWEL